jgi:uncharacterized protein (TIGR02246 family)
LISAKFPATVRLDWQGDRKMNRRSSIAACLGLVLAAITAPAAVSARTANPPQKCEEIDTGKVKALFVKWDKALEDITAKEVVALYARDATLLPTVENGPYTTPAEIKKYFVHFVARKPVPTIDETKRVIELGCNVAYDIGLYTFELNGEHTDNRETVKARYTFIYKWDTRAKKWLIAHHHSSKEPQ